MCLFQNEVLDIVDGSSRLVVSFGEEGVFLKGSFYYAGEFLMNLTSDLSGYRHFDVLILLGCQNRERTLLGLNYAPAAKQYTRRIIVEEVKRLLITKISNIPFTVMHLFGLGRREHNGSVIVTDGQIGLFRILVGKLTLMNEFANVRYGRGVSVLEKQSRSLSVILEGEPVHLYNRESKITCINPDLVPLLGS